MQAAYPDVDLPRSPEVTQRLTALAGTFRLAAFDYHDLGSKSSAAWL